MIAPFPCFYLIGQNCAKGGVCNYSTCVDFRYQLSDREREMSEQHPNSRMCLYMAIGGDNQPCCTETNDPCTHGVMGHVCDMNDPKTLEEVLKMRKEK